MAVFPASGTSGGMIYTYTVGVPTASATSYDNVVSNVTILNQFVVGANTYTVTSIAASVFQAKNNLVTVTIPASVITIGNFAFYLCANLTSVTFSGTSLLETIGTNAFQESKLSTIAIPDKVKILESNTFRLCANLTSVTFSGTSLLESIGVSAFQETKLSSVAIPNKVNNLGNFAFYRCASLTSVTFTGTSLLQTIGTNAFQETKLSTITIPAPVISIGNFAFFSCTLLTNIVWVDPSLTTLGSNVFATNITTPPLGTVTYYQTYYNSPIDTNLPAVLNPPLGPASIYNSLYNIYYVNAPICFNKGTEILCLNEETGEEEYVLIEHLKKGDLVKSFNQGYRKIDIIVHKNMINIPSKPLACMYKMEKTETNRLTKDLIVTGGHSVLVDDLGELKEANDKMFRGDTPKIDGKYLLLSSVSPDFMKLENHDIYTWYHFTLENDGENDRRFGVWANGMLTETPSKNLFLQMV